MHINQCFVVSDLEEMEQKHEKTSIRALKAQKSYINGENKSKDMRTLQQKPN